MGFEILDQAIPVSAALPLTEDTVAFDDEALTDEAALSIVKADVDAAVSFVQSKGLPVDWDQSDDLYRGYVKPRTWPGTDVARANLSMHLILEVIEKLMPEIYLSFFSDEQPFILEPKGRTTPEAARARGKVLNWALRSCDFREQMRRMMKQCLQYGYCLGKYGWEQEERTVKTYKRKPNSDEIEVVEKKITINKPCFENIEIRSYMLDPKLRQQNPKKGRFVVFQKFVTADDLVDLAELDCFKNVPTKEELREILTSRSEPTVDSMKGAKPMSWRDLQAEPIDSGVANTSTGGGSSDPLANPLELLEWWSDDRVITSLQRIICIRNEEHEFDDKPFVGCAFIDVMGSAYGFGIAKILSGEQRFETGVLNSWIDQLALQLNPVFQTVKGMNSGVQNVKFSPGKVITEASELKPLIQQSVTQEALGAIQSSENRANRRVGSNGGSDMPTQALRTAQGVNAFQEDVTSRLQYFIEIFSNMVFIPVLEAFIKMLNDHLKPSQIQQILNDEDGKDYEGDLMEIYNANTSVDVLATTKLAARKAMAQLVPALIQMASAAPVQDSLTQQGKKMNYVELLEDALTWAGMDADEFIQNMTPADMQRSQQMNPALQKAQGDAQKQNLDNQGKLQQIEAQGTAKAGVEVVKHILNESKDENQLPTLLQQMTGGGQPTAPAPSGGDQEPQVPAPTPQQPQQQQSQPQPQPQIVAPKQPTNDHFQGANQGQK